MRVPLSWLREYVDPGLSAEDLADLLSMRAVDVERVTRVGAPSPDGFVIGKVLSAEKHPNADRLSVTEVDTGDGTRTIVCGAPNVAAGQTVPVGLPGAVMPGGMELGQAKLRGVVSDGMILSETELEVGEDSDGIIAFPEEYAPGTPLADVLPIAEEVLELDLNPNRIDLFGVYGVAREVHAITGAELAPPPWRDDAEATGSQAVDELASVDVEIPDLCPRFTARVFTGVRMGSSPLWLKQRLAAAGQRPISNVVDITNYVMLLTAQPLHAYDLDKVPEGRLIVRAARAGEVITTLDGVAREADDETVLVCDRDGPSGGIAGIMGGQVSEVSAATTRVLLEVANWDGMNILRTEGFLGLRSEASTRFEKQLHPETTMWAQAVASRLLVELCGAELAPGTIDEAAEIPAPHVISLHGTRLDSLLGVEVPRENAIRHLEALEFGVVVAGERDLEATVPLHRHYDVTREADLIEEVGRLEGFDRLPRTLPAARERVGRLSREQLLRRRSEDVLADLGFDEIVAWHFDSPGLPARLGITQDDVRHATVQTGNPLSEEQSAMRTTLLGGLLGAARHNLARGAERVALFESGRAYLREPAPTEGGPLAGRFGGDRPAPVHEPHRLAAIAVGPLRAPSWGGEPPEGFFAMKGILEALCRRVGAPLAVEPGSEPFLHPGRAATLELAGMTAGWLGEIHPRVAAEWDIPGGTAFELDLAPLIAASGAGAEHFEDVTSYPAVLQDLAVVIPDDIPAEAVQRAVASGGGELLRGARIFDLYRGDQVGAGHKSLALRLEFRAPDRTLTDEEVGGLREAIKSEVEALGGSLRE